MHGSGPLKLSSRHQCNPPGVPSSCGGADPLTWPGNMLRQPDRAKGETFRAGGLIGADGTVTNECRLNDLMRRLSARMMRARDAGIWETSLTGGEAVSASDNPSIPSGYTYLLQLIGHDMVDSVPFVALDNVARPAFRNGRLAPLVLDTIYGAGPDQAPHAYEVSERHRNSSGVIPRNRLRLGDLKLEERPSGTQYCPCRDIARLARWGERSTRDYPDWQTEPLIADARNDDHALISQLTVLFHKLHNAVMELVEQRHARAPAASQPFASRSEIEIAYPRFLWS